MTTAGLSGGWTSFRHPGRRRGRFGGLELTQERQRSSVGAGLDGRRRFVRGRESRRHPGRRRSRFGGLELTQERQRQWDAAPLSRVWAVVYHGLVAGPANPNRPHGRFGGRGCAERRGGAPTRMPRSPTVPRFAGEQLRTCQRARRQRRFGGSGSKTLAGVASRRFTLRGQFSVRRTTGRGVASHHLPATASVVWGWAKRGNRTRHPAVMKERTSFGLSPRCSMARGAGNSLFCRTNTGAQGATCFALRGRACSAKLRGASSQ